MSPPVEPRSGPVTVTFVDTPAAIGVSEDFTPSENGYPTLLNLLHALSASVSHKLENLPHQYVQGQGFTLADGGWWYRFVKPVEAGVDRADPGEVVYDYGPWTYLDCLYGYDKLAAELTLGVKWKGANVEVRHNMQKKRDEAVAQQAQQIGTGHHIFQQPLPRPPHGLDGAPILPSFVILDDPQQNPDSASAAVKEVLQQALHEPFHGSDSVGQEEGMTIVSQAPSLSLNVDESHTSGDFVTGDTGPVVVSTPFTGRISTHGDDDDSDDCATPKAIPSTSVAKLPTQTSKVPSEMTADDRAVIDPELLGPGPKLVLPPPRATGSPNDKYRQVARSGGGVRVTDAKLPHYPYGGREHQLVGGQAPHPASVQPYLHPQQSALQSQYYSPAARFHQSASTSNQRQLYDPHPAPTGNRGRSRGGFNASKPRGTHAPLDPALEKNFKNFGGPDQYNTVQSQHVSGPNPSSGYGYGNVGSTASSPMVGSFAQQGQQQPFMPSPYATEFIPSPYATEFMPRSANFLQQVDEQGQAPGQDLAFSSQFAAIRELSSQQRRNQGQEAAVRSQIPDSAQHGPTMLPPQNFAQQGPAMLPPQNFAQQGPTMLPQNFAQQGPAMLPPFAPTRMGGYMLVPMQPSAEILSQAGLPYITPYEPPKPAMQMLMPPMGEFTPPKLRKMMQEMEMPEKMTTGGMAKLGALYGIDEHVIIDDDEDDDDGDADYNPKQEGWKKKQKKQQKKQQTKQQTKKSTDKSKQRVGWTQKGDGVAQGGQGATTMTAPPATMTAPPTMTPPIMTAPTMTVPTATAPPNMIAPRPMSAPPTISAPTTTTTETPAMARLSTDSETQDGIEEDVKMTEG